MVDLSSFFAGGAPADPHNMAPLHSYDNRHPHEVYPAWNPHGLQESPHISGHPSSQPRPMSSTLPYSHQRRPAPLNLATSTVKQQPIPSPSSNDPLLSQRSEADIHATPGAWREYSSVLMPPAEVSNLMIPELPTSATSSLETFVGGQRPTLSRHHSAGTPLENLRSLSSMSLASSTSSSSTHSRMVPRSEGTTEGALDSPEHSLSMVYSQPPQPWMPSPQADSSPHSTNLRRIATPQRIQHHSPHTAFTQQPVFPSSFEFDYTDHRLSAALASNAQISSSSDLAQQGNTTPTIMEEEEESLKMPAMYMGQQQPDPIYAEPQMPTANDGMHDFSLSQSRDISAVRKGEPHMRPSIFQQYTSLDMRGFDDAAQSSEDCLPFIKDVIGNYLSTPSRLGLGERSVLIMTSKVAQKSYGAEKRFLCPPPMVLLVGSSWWSACQSPMHVDDKQPTVLTPPRLSISMSGEDSGQESVLEWASSNGKLLDTDNASSDFAISGRSIGRQLFINDSDEPRKHCEALVHINLPAKSASERRSLGTFSSRPIKVISKPSKKRQSTRNTELGVLHGSLISLFHRLRSQTVSTRYLCVSGAPTWFKGSDGEPFLNNDANTHIPHQGEPQSCFVAKMSSWDPFIIYLVDPSIDANSDSAKQRHNDLPHHSSRPTHYPPPPFNALPYGTGTQAIHYNQPIVLQCLNTAVVSPVMVIRKVERSTTVIGGGQVPGLSGAGPGTESYGDPVSQLHKIALEVLDDSNAKPPMADARETSTPGQSGHFLGCLKEDVGLRKPPGVRQWASGSVSRPTTPTTPLTPMTMQHSGHTADSSLDFKMEPFSPTSMAATYANAQSRFAANQRMTMPASVGAPPSAYPSDMGDQDHGAVVKRPRRVSSSVLVSQNDRNAGSTSSNRRRGQSLSVVGLQSQIQQAHQRHAQPYTPDITRRTGSYTHSISASDTSSLSVPPSSLWTVDVHDSDVWTIVGVDIARHTFYLPPKLVGGVKGPAENVDSSIAHLVNVPVPMRPITPLPHVHSFKKARMAQKRTTNGAPGDEFVTLSGENLSAELFVFFGDWRCPHVSVQSPATILCAPPAPLDDFGIPRDRLPITLVRRDGVIFPTSCIYEA